MRESESATILARIGEKSRVSMTSGTFVSYDATGCIVDIGTGRVPASFGTDYLPDQGEQVQVFFIDSVPYVMGPVVPHPGVGTVLTIGSGRITVATPVGTLGPMPYSGTAPTVGQTVRLTWREGPWAMLSTDAVAPVAPPTPGGPAVTTHVDTFYAIAAGTWYTGGDDTADHYYNSQVIASPSNIGGWFYGTKIPDTIPGSAVIQRVELYVAATQILYDPPVFTTHASPGGPLTTLSGGTASVVRNNQWVDISPALGNPLRRGGGSYGIGVRHGGFTIFKSLAADGSSGALRITSVY